MLSQVASSTYASPVRRAGKEPAALKMNNHVLIEITGTAGVDEARRVSFDLARQAAFDDSVAERAALIATEAAANILRHAGARRILDFGRLGAWVARHVAGLERVRYLLAPGAGHGAPCAGLGPFVAILRHDARIRLSSRQIRRDLHGRIGRLSGRPSRSEGDW